MQIEQPSHLAVRNFERYQHYSKRKPPWIRLYRELLNDEDFMALDDASRFHIIGFFLLASRYDNRIPYDPKLLRQLLHASKPINYRRLFASGMLAPCYQDASKMLASRAPSEAQKHRSTEVQKTEKTEKIPPTPLSAEFDVFWQAYPGPKSGRKEAEQHFRSSVTTEEDIVQIGLAIAIYTGHLTANAWKRPQNGSTWFGNWQDWIKWEDWMGPQEDRSREDRDRDLRVPRLEAPTWPDVPHTHRCSWCAEEAHDWECSRECCPIPTVSACAVFVKKRNDIEEKSRQIQKKG